MEKGLETLIREGEEDLKRIRRTYFPLISEGIITGYNIYSDLWKYVSGKVHINFLHAHTRHFLRLSEILKQELGGDIGIIERETLKDRYATYITDPKWDTQVGMRYFDEQGNEKLREQAIQATDKQREIFGEAIQYDWLISLQDKNQLRKTIDILKKYASKYLLDIFGRTVTEVDKKKENVLGIEYSWEVPIITYKNQTSEKIILDDFSHVKEVIFTDLIGVRPVAVSTFCGNETLEKLKRKSLKFIYSIDKQMLNEPSIWIEPLHKN